MDSPFSQPLRYCLALLICLDLFKSSQVLAQSGDGGGAQGVEPGDIGAGPSSTDAGAAGPDTGSVNLSKGATIAIIVVVTVVVILGGMFSRASQGAPFHGLVLIFCPLKAPWPFSTSWRRRGNGKSKRVSGAQPVRSPTASRPS